MIITFSRDGKTQPAQTTAEQAAAILAYLKTLDPPVTDFDNGTMSGAAKRGEELFRGKAACVSCHGGPMFTKPAINKLIQAFFDKHLKGMDVPVELVPEADVTVPDAEKK